MNAGHLPGILRRVDETFERVGLTGGGVALGMFEQGEYTASSVTIAPGDEFVLFTDGITEAETPGGRPFDESGLEAVLAAQAGANPETPSRAVFRAVEVHVDSARPADDLTTLVLQRRRSQGQEAGSRELRSVVSAAASPAHSSTIGTQRSRRRRMRPRESRTDQANLAGSPTLQKRHSSKPR